MFSVTRCLMWWLASALLASAAQTNDPFAEYVRTTEPLTPEAEVKTFRLPEGFEIQLFAAEPDIAKPMNMAFDERGRLWVSESREYPFAVPLDKKGRDAIKVLEDTNGDGRADKVTTFADELNIPIGIYPYKGGAIAWSIPNIWHFQDTDGDGKADKRDVLFGPLGWEKDTHGMNASFRRAFDGWIYITHGFNNTSVIKGRDGSELKINSGNTYRVRPDGSRVEIHSWGQVNPFGLTFDPLGYLYSADCHSSPIYQLIPGAYYPSFGKPDDGLGFAPVLMQHSHNSTAIGGIAYYADNLWPPDFRDNIFVGNVMTSRVNRDHVRFDGASPSAKELPDFLTSSDPWFRPMDLQFGPDGALYVADFYNRIIGHYEVPLTHPGRDRERGRIWRISYRGKKHPSLNLVGLTPGQVAAEFASPNLTRRLLALNHLVDSVGRTGMEAARRTLATSPNTDARVSGLWALHRLGGLQTRDLSPAFSHDDPKLRVHAARVLAEMPALDYDAGLHAVGAVNDIHRHVERAGAEALARHPSVKNLERLIVQLQFVPPADNHLLHTMRIALRNHLQLEGAFAALEKVPGGLTERSARAVADVCVAVTNQEAGAYLLRYVEQHEEAPTTTARYLRHVAKQLPREGVDRLVRLARNKFATDIDGQLTMFKSVQDGLAQRGEGLTGPAKSWGEELAGLLLRDTADSEMGWSNVPIEGMKETKNPWFLQRRKCADGTNARFLCSLPPGGEHLTGTLRSSRFTIPPRLTFYVAGHDGPPDKGPQGKNLVRLRGAQNEVLMQAAAPRNDTAQQISWDLAAPAGKSGFLEVVDADTGGAYAWLAVGRFEPPVVAIPRLDPSEISKRQLAGADLARTLGLKQLQPQLITLLGKGSEVAPAAARAIAALADNNPLEAVAFLYADENAPASLRVPLASAFARANDTKLTREVVTEAIRISPSRLQLKIAQGLAASGKGADALINMAEQRIAPRGLLQDRSVREKLLAANPALAADIDTLTKGLTPPNDAIQKLIDRRRKGLDPAKARSSEGAQLFTKHCAACHQLNKQGGLVGPQLDGIRSRGVERLLEDILDPNRSVDPAFRSTLLVMKDDDVVSGLLRREEGETIVLADSMGKEIAVQKSKVAERRQSETSLMPENVGELLSAEEFNHLLGFLLSH